MRLGVWQTGEVSVRTFRSFADADKADLDEWMELSGNERLRLGGRCASRKPKPMNQGFREFFALLNSRGVEFLVIGGVAYNFYAPPHATKDLKERA